MLLLSLHTYTYMNLHEWGVLGQRLSIDTSYVDDLGEIFERFCNAAQFLWEVCCLSLSQKDGEPEGHDLNRQMYRMIQWYWYRHMANFLDQACRQQLAVSRWQPKWAKVWRVYLHEQMSVPSVFLSRWKMLSITKLPRISSFRKEKYWSETLTQFQHVLCIRLVIGVFRADETKKANFVPIDITPSGLPAQVGTTRASRAVLLRLTERMQLPYVYFATQFG